MTDITNKIITEFSNLLDKIVQDEGRSQSFISTKHSNELDHFLKQSLEKAIQEAREETIQEVKVMFPFHNQFCEVKGRQFNTCIKCFLDTLSLKEKEKK
ncbi:MAG: hypothetical protein AABY22_32995 [Nanoarchaeota archaeon]